MKLYRLETIGLGDFYVVAETATEAEEFLTGNLDKANYGFSDKRKVFRIDILASEMGLHYANKDILNFSSNNKLLIKK